MAKFAIAFEITSAHEGGYVNDPADAGGETYRGISRRYNPGWEGWVDIDAFKDAGAFPQLLDENAAIQTAVASFYKARYWDIFLGDEIIEQALANEIYDTGVNMGTTRAVQFLQDALNCLNRNGTIWLDLVPDGKIGKKSLEALAGYFAFEEGPELLLKIVNVMQGAHYIEYMKKSPAQEKYARGWFKRVTI